MKRTLDNCSLIKKMVRSGIGTPEQNKDKWCMGYCHSEYDDEPCDVCQKCKWEYSNVETKEDTANDKCRSNF